MPYELLEDDQKKKLGKNNEAKMTLYNALPQKEYERVFMCKTTKEVWHILASYCTKANFIKLRFPRLTSHCKYIEKFSSSMKKNNFDLYAASPRSMLLMTREKTSDDSDSKGGSDEDIDEEEAEEFNLLARNFCKDDWIVDSGCTKHMTRNRRLFTSYKEYDGGHVVFRSNPKGKVVNRGSQGNANNRAKKEVSTNRILELLHLDLVGPSCIQSYGGYSQTSKAYIVLNKETMRIEESFNVTFDESLLEPKSSSLVEDDRIDEPEVQDLNGSPSLQVNVSDEGYPKSLKEARGHPIKQVISELNERTLRSKTKQA
ncbi:hypothetical protein Tco_1110708 [Tanacetum coccineum]|uniref:Uncharacterized protein n=1 Tax=Tanacetum coccineum TaxID=301880 RepID=A0ABQ5IL37_9ASTR